jgi:hypothetical protein
MKLHTGLVFAACASLGLISYACVNGDTVQNGTTGTGGSTSGSTGGSSSGQTGGNGSSTGGNTGSGTGGSHTGTGGSVTSTGGNGSGTGGNSSSTGGNGSSTGGSTGSGTGGTTSTASTCNMGASFKPMSALVTDFSDTSTTTTAGKIAFGSSTGDPGTTTVFKNNASTAGTLAVSGEALTFTATVSAAGTTGDDQYPYNGFELILNGPACADVSTYTGVSLKIGGSVGTCSLVFAFNDSEHTNASDDAMRGLGTGSAYAPQLDISKMVASTAAVVMIPFASTFTGGSPAVTTSYPDKTKFTGIEFQFTQPMTATKTCMGMLTIDDVKFY